MSRFLLDTNVISEPLRPQPNAAVIQRLQQYQGEFAIASVTWHELLFGCYRLPASKRRTPTHPYLLNKNSHIIAVISYS